MKKIFYNLFTFYFIVILSLTGCRPVTTSTSSSEPISSDTISSTPIPSKMISSSALSSEVSEVVSDSISSSETNSSSTSQSTNDATSNVIKKISMKSGNALTEEYKIDYELSSTEVAEFMKLYNNLKLEYVKPYPNSPGAGSMCPCQITIEYSDGRENTYINFPEFTSNQKKFKATSGAKEILKFISNFDCYKNEKIDLYELWQNDNGK